MKSVLIVGVGNIGSRLFKEYISLSPDRYDPYKGYDEKRDIRYDFAFIATDTPMREDGSCDLSQVSRADLRINHPIIQFMSDFSHWLALQGNEQQDRQEPFCLHRT